MGLFDRSSRSPEIAPGIRADVGGSGVSYTAGPWGARVSGRARGGRNAGIGCFWVLGMMVLAGFCSAGTDGSGDSPYSTPPSVPSVVETAPSNREAAQETELFYVHGVMNVRSGPGTSYPTVRTLSPGESVRLGPKDANGWAELISYGGTREGYLYRASDLVRTSPPPEPTPREASTSAERTRSSSRSSAESRGYYTGPRGGCYTYTASGRKRYVDRSYCN